MRVTEIQYERKKNLGNYESADLRVNAVVEEGDTVNDTIQSIERLVDWHINRAERDAKYQQYVAELATETCEKREQKEKWVAQYETRKAEMEAI